MRTTRLLCGIAAAAVLVAMPATLSLRGPPSVSWSAANAAVTVSIDSFFTTLAPYGAWIQSTDYNYVWVPTQVDADWSPYTSGHWVYTEQYGWYFASEDPYAWIVYHYGRWGYDQLVGWYWVPGTQWAPAWVAWRKGDTSIGWAPLPPQGNGYALSVSINITIGDLPDHSWRFVPTNQFLAPQLRTIAFAGDRRPDLYKATQPAGTVIIQNNTVINNVINITYVEQQTNTKVQVAKVETVSDPKDAAGPQANSPTSIKAFIGNLAAPDKTVAPAKVVAKAEVQAPTKGQATTAPATAAVAPNATVTPAPVPGAAAGATGTAAVPPGTVNPGNPRCTDTTFAKDNPKDCAPAASIAATPPVGATIPPAAAAGPSAIPPAAAAGPPAVQGNLNVTPNCADAAFAKANPKDCAAAAGAGANVKAPATAALPPAATPPPAVQGNAGAKADPCSDPAFAKGNPKTCTVDGANAPGNAQGAKAPVVVLPPAAGVTGGVTVQGNAALGDPRCADLTFAKNNAKTCPVVGATGAAPAIVPPAQK